MIAGVFATAGIWLLLHVFGMGVGLTAIQPDDPSSLRGVGIGTGIWSLIVPLIALFLGGLITGYLGNPIRHLTAVIHGVVLWSIATTLSIVLLLAFASAMVSSAVQAGGQVVSATGAVAGAAAASADEVSSDVLGAFDTETWLAPINEELQEQGKPTLTADQLEAAARDALQAALREGRLDMELMVTSLTRNTDMSRQEARDVAQQLQQLWDQRTAMLSQQAQELGQAAGRTALEAAEATGKALLWLSLMMVLGVIATAGGVLLVEVRRTRARDTPRARAVRT